MHTDSKSSDFVSAATLKNVLRKHASDYSGYRVSTVFFDNTALSHVTKKTFNKIEKQYLFLKIQNYLFRMLSSFRGKEYEYNLFALNLFFVLSFVCV